MIIDVTLKPCPWCRKTPDIWMPIEKDETWCWKIKCRTECCTVNPETKHVSIRNKKKRDPKELVGFLAKLAGMWNCITVFNAFERKVVDISKLVEV